MDPEHAAPDPLAGLFNVGIAFMTSLQPGWELPVLLPPDAQPFGDSHELARDVSSGDHIAVMNPSGYWHHGVFVGKQDATGASMVVSVWGEDKSEAQVTWRTLGQFVAGGARFAIITYKEGAALSREHSAALALHLRANTGAAGCYNVAFSNCESSDSDFATMCRSLRWEMARAVAHCLCALPTHPAAPPAKRGFK
jgi:hypothetical protein